MSLARALARFDGKHTAELKEALPQAEADPQALLRACLDPSSEIAATWIAKALIETGREQFEPAELFILLPRLSAPEAQLHVLQCIQHAPNAALDQADTVRTLLQNRKTLVRVWALDAFVRIADQRAELQRQARALVSAALDAKAASERARARKLQEVVARWP